MMTVNRDDYPPGPRDCRLGSVCDLGGLWGLVEQGLLEPTRQL